MKTTVKGLKNNTLVEFKGKLWLKEGYNRTTKKYILQDYWDISNFKEVKGETQVILL